MNSPQAIEKLRMIASKAGDLPPMPATALKALQMTEDPNVSARALQAVILQDQALTARVLRIVNSAMYSLSREVSTVSHAVTLLGIATIRSIIMAASVQQVFREGMVQGHDLTAKLLYDHSWGAGIAARTVAAHVRYTSPEEAFLCGLMHDIGKPILFKNFPDQYTDIVSNVYRRAARFEASELERFGFSHADVGALVCEKWNFPPQFSESIGYHHKPLAAPKHAALACVISVANSMMILMEVGFERDPALDIGNEPAAKVLDLGRAVLDSLTQQVREAMDQLRNVMNG